MECNTIINKDASNDIIERVNRLERINRFLIMTIVCISVGFVFLVTAGAGPDKMPEVIEGAYFVVKDSQGKTRASLGLNPIDEEPMITFSDSNNYVRSFMNSSEISFDWPVGNARSTVNNRIRLGFFPGDLTHGEAFLQIRDSQGKTRCRISCDKDDSYKFIIKSSEGKDNIIFDNN